MKNPILFILMLVVYSSLTAQFKPGFVITHEHDSIRGLINMKGSRLNSQLCEFKQDSSSSPVIYQPEDILGYRFSNGKYYLSSKVQIAGESRNVFLEFLIDGKVDMFFYRDASRSYFFSRKDDGDIFLLETDQQMINRESSMYAKPPKYIGMLKYTFIESPKVSSRISETSLDQKNLINLARDYHNEVCDDYECIVFETQVVKKSFTYGIIAGGGLSVLGRGNTTPFADHQHLQEYEQIRSSSYFIAGLFLSHNLPWVGDRSSLQYQLSVSQREYHEEKPVPALSGETVDNKRLDISGMLLGASLIYQQKLSASKISPLIRGGFRFDYNPNVHHIYLDQRENENGDTFVREKYDEYEKNNIDFSVVLGSGVSYTLPNKREAVIAIEYSRGFSFLPGFGGNNFQVRLFIPLLSR